MQNISPVKFRKYTRMTVVRRRNIVTIPEKTAKYIHTSARFATMMSDIGIERIGSYVRSMAHHNEVLTEMVNTGFIDIRMLTDEVASISEESERTSADLALIGNSLIRFMHADSESSKGTRKIRTRRGNNPSPEIQQETPGQPLLSKAEARDAALTASDTHE